MKQARKVENQGSTYLLRFMIAIQQLREIQVGCLENETAKKDVPIHNPFLRKIYKEFGGMCDDTPSPLPK